jgi:mRNA-degrading endonuclease RelE of RelBE toxin-antitoxin system
LHLNDVEYEKSIRVGNFQIIIIIDIDNNHIIVLWVNFEKKIVLKRKTAPLNIII